MDIATDSAVDLEQMLERTATGAVAGSFFLPPVGTAVGAGCRWCYNVNELINLKLGEIDLIDITKKGV